MDSRQKEDLLQLVKDLSELKGRLDADKDVIVAAIKDQLSSEGREFTKTMSFVERTLAGVKKAIKDIDLGIPVKPADIKFWSENYNSMLVSVDELTTRVMVYKEDEEYRREAREGLEYSKLTTEIPEMLDKLDKLSDPSEKKGNLSSDYAKFFQSVTSRRGDYGKLGFDKRNEFLKDIKVHLQADIEAHKSGPKK
jgi:hypothetical protein